MSLALTDGPVQLMRAIDRGKVLKVNKIVSPCESPEKFGIVGSNFMFRISGSPGSDRGRAIRLKVNCRELDNPNQNCYVMHEAVVPQQS